MGGGEDVATVLPSPPNPTGDTATVTSVIDYTTTTTTYNLTIDATHDYYVEADTTAVLVHNCGDTWTSPGSLRDHFSEHGTEVGAQSEAEYEAGAAFMSCDCDLSEMLRRFDSATQTAYYFDKATDDFAVKSPKGIVNYFRLSRGVDYFNDEPGGVVVPGDAIP